MKKLIFTSMLICGAANANNELNTKGVADVIFDKGHFEESVILAFTSFEEPTGFIGGKYTSSGDPCTEHDLVNNLEQNPVETTEFVVEELGFDASFIPPSGCDSSGFDDGLGNDWVGVTSFTGNLHDYQLDPDNRTFTTYTDGEQGYQINDTDGTLVLESEEISLIGRENLKFSIDYFFNDYDFFDPADPSGWEIDDFLRVYLVNLDNMTEYDVVNLTGGIGSDSIENTNPSITYLWNTSEISLPDNVRVKIYVEAANNSGNERIFIDNIKITGL